LPTSPSLGQDRRALPTANKTGYRFSLIGATSIFLALGIAIALVALTTWLTHYMWFLRSFGLPAPLFRHRVVHDVIRKNWLRYVLGVMRLMIPIVGGQSWFAIWVGAGAQLRD
jgi:hypothetical protein